LTEAVARVPARAQSSPRDLCGAASVVDGAGCRKPGEKLNRS
jgi:hypothetical protein